MKGVHMNKQALRALGLLALVQSGCIAARDIRTPLPLYTGYIGYVHYPVDLFNDEYQESCLGVETQMWGAGYVRSAPDGYGPSNDNCCPTQAEDPCANGRVPLAEIIFGQDSFTLAQAFANASVGTNIPQNPWVSVSTLSPNYDYNERGVFFGFVLNKRFGCEDQWRAGVRIALPFRDIEMEEKCGDLVGETIDDVFRKRQETIEVVPGTPETNTAWTARLDFLSALKQIAFDVNGNAIDLVRYVNSTSSNHMTIGSQDITAPSITNTSPFIAAIDSTNGTIPASVRWANTPQSSATPINGDGTGLTNLVRGYFPSTNNYAALGTSSAQQRQLWIVPNVNGDTTIGGGVILGASNTVLTEIEQSLSDIQSSVTDFLVEHDINFCSGRSRGLGDLDMEWYLNRQWCNYMWAEVQLGVRFPTSKHLTALDVRKLALQPLGNNGHFEVRPGLVLASEYLEWVKFKADLTYSFVLKHNEYLPAAFKGATVRNVGPAVPGCVSWGYFVGDFDMTFMNPCNPCAGWTIAYQAYVKQKDKICFQCPEARDYIGTIQTLDASILTADSKRVAHTIRTERYGCISWSDRNVLTRRGVLTHTRGVHDTMCKQ